MNNLAIKVAWAFAATLLGACLLGFIPNPLVGENALFITNTLHNLVHLATAIGFALVALLGAKASIRFMLVFGGVYILISLFGFVTLGSNTEGYLLNIIHINLLDNFLHLGLGIVIAASGWLLQKHYQNRYIFIKTAGYLYSGHNIKQL